MEVTVSKVDSPAECARLLPLRREFHQSLPVNVVFGRPGDEPPQSTYGPEDFLIIAEDSEGNVIGYAANHVKTSDEPNPSPDERNEVDSPAERARVLPLLHEFRKSLPVNVVFGVSGSDRSEPRYGPEDFLIIAEDSEGNVVGFAANKVKVAREPDPSPERLELEEFLEFIGNNIPLDTLPQRCIELRVLAVTEGWRGRGVARKLVERSVDAARAAGFSTLTMCCVSEFSARLVRSLGWKELYRLAYSDYSRLSGRSVQLNPNPPHDHVYCYYTEL